MWLVVGLGNPGPDYEQTRHNAGFMVETALRQQCSADAPRSKFGAETCSGQIGDQRVQFLRPMQFMNNSGQAVASAAAFFKIAPDNILVAHDDIDLPFGRIRVATQGGHGGHNGIRSMIEHLATREFPRVRVGVGRPVHGDAADHVLARFSKTEQSELDDFVKRAADAVMTFVTHGATAAMNAFNIKDSRTEKLPR